MVLKFLLLWTSKKNASLFVTQRADSVNQSYNEMLVKIVIQASQLDLRFPHSSRVKKLSAHLAGIAGKLLQDSVTTESAKISQSSKEDLFAVLHFCKERLRVETSDLARDLRDTHDASHSIMVLESLQLQLSQISNLDLQISCFLERLQPAFIAVCQSALGLEDDKEVLVSIAKILEALLPQTEFLVKTKNSLGQEQLSVFCDREYQRILRKKCRKLYKAFAHGVNALIT